MKGRFEPLALWAAAVLMVAASAHADPPGREKQGRGEARGQSRGESRGEARGQGGGEERYNPGQGRYGAPQAYGPPQGYAPPSVYVPRQAYAPPPGYGAPQGYAQPPYAPAPSSSRRAYVAPAQPYQPAPAYPSARSNSLGAQWAQQQDQARDLRREGRILPLSSVLQSVQRLAPGRVLDAGLEPGPDGRQTYRVRWAATGGRRIDFIIDAETGAVIGRGSE